MNRKKVQVDDLCELTAVEGRLTVTPSADKPSPLTRLYASVVVNLSERVYAYTVGVRYAPRFFIGNDALAVIADVNVVTDGQRVTERHVLNDDGDYAVALLSDAIVVNFAGL